MFRWHRADDIMAVVNIAQRNFKLTVNRGFSCERFKRLSLDSHIPLNNFSNFMQVTPPWLNVHRCNLVRVSRNFSTTKTVWNKQKSNQDRTKMKNYITLAVIVSGALFAAGVNLTAERHQDYIILDPEEEKK